MEDPPYNNDLCAHDEERGYEDYLSPDTD